ncbi:hypothetical protein [Pseudoxanthomonas winnipegensis]|uniref:Immunity protein 26 of polymorphic toxin system n=1 Tax=Pseudoxanthomonas winnipegensis TaxID=2480810 RepID=A0A4Q8LXG1_9GAMM|nr:hypothetical protein [Pseudoxanthomonas winnipegensis]TAA36250.1 hypothetical protein EA655_19135 [Pseudoxanthomonas winnipegensis]
MIQIRAGDLLSVKADEGNVVFAVLTKKLLFGGNWCYVFHPREPLEDHGFNAFVDFIVPKREGRVTRLSSGNDFSNLGGPELLKQHPTRGEKGYAIYRWSNFSIASVTHIRTTQYPTKEELAAPEYACLPAEFACELALRQWQPQDWLWVV